MKKIYASPAVTISCFKSENILTKSEGGLETNKFKEVTGGITQVKILK